MAGERAASRSLRSAEGAEGVAVTSVMGRAAAYRRAKGLPIAPAITDKAGTMSVRSATSRTGTHDARLLRSPHARRLAHHRQLRLLGGTDAASSRAAPVVTRGGLAFPLPDLFPPTVDARV